MKNLSKSLIIGVLLLGVLSCNRVKTISEVKETYADGKPKKVEEYINDEQGNKILYKETYYFPGEKKYVSGTYNNTQLRNGVWTSWYENGKKNSQQNYIDGVEDGAYNVWHHNGNQWIKGEYKMGVKVGIWTFHDTLGKVTKETNFGGK